MGDSGHREAPSMGRFRGPPSRAQQARRFATRHAWSLAGGEGSGTLGTRDICLRHRAALDLAKELGAAFGISGVVTRDYAEGLTGA